MNKNKAIIYIVFSFLLFNLTSYSQDFIPAENREAKKENKGFDASRLFFGGGLGFQMGTTTYIAIAPEVGYRITERFGAGVGFSYFYMSSSVPPSYSTNIYGGKVLAYYVLFENAFVYSEYELLNLESRYFNPNIYPTTKRFNVSSFLVGPGYRFPLGENSYLKLMILWNLNENVYTPYSNPVVRLNFEF